jgi:hypothetical protein
MHGLFWASAEQLQQGEDDDDEGEEKGEQGGCSFCFCFCFNLLLLLLARQPSSSLLLFLLLLFSSPLEVPCSDSPFFVPGKLLHGGSAPPQLCALKKLLSRLSLPTLLLLTLLNVS